MIFFNRDREKRHKPWVAYVCSPLFAAAIFAGIAGVVRAMDPEPLPCLYYERTEQTEKWFGNCRSEQTGHTDNDGLEHMEE